MSDHVARSALSRMNNREVAIAVQYGDLASDMSRLAAALPEREEVAAQARRADLCAAYGFNPPEQRKPFAFSNGIAIIPVHGMLINRFGSSWGYVTGYNFIRQQTAQAGQDPDVIGIVYDMNSYGGEVAGCFECSADLSTLSNGKPTLSVVDANCYSACYAMAAGTDKIVVTPSAGVGSIGVVRMHVSMEKMLSDAGIKVTFIHAGKHKVDGNPYEDLPDDVKAAMQKDIDIAYATFVSHVAEGRGMDEKAVRTTEARTYRADDALSLGLIDAVATPPVAMQAFLGELSGSNSQPRKKEDKMSNQEVKPGATSSATPDVAAERASAAAAERSRIQAITSSDEAKGRESMANHLAYSTSMTADEAKALLATAPKAEAKSEPVNPLAAAMANTAQPNVGADGSAVQTDDKVEGVNGILAAARMAGVRGFEVPAKH